MAGALWIKLDTSNLSGDLKSLFKKLETAFANRKADPNKYESAKKAFYEKAKGLVKKGKIPEGKEVMFNYTGQALLYATRDRQDTAGQPAEDLFDLSP